MSLTITSLNSGSNGNCYYIGNRNEAVLVDAGISVRETEKRMSRLGLSPHLLKAIFVSHEHGDHITGVPGLSKKYRLPVYITKSTHEASRIPIEAELCRYFSAETPIRINAITVTPFVKAHDACDPHSFFIMDDHVNVGVFTDIGKVCDKTISHFRNCHAVFLEANYCEQMLENGRYPFHLKRRISGGNGHLSNRQALELFKKHRHAQLRYLILSHLSNNNNDPELVSKIFNEEKKSTRIVVASRFHEMPLITLSLNVQMALF